MQDYFVRKECGQLRLKGMMLSEEERKIVERRLGSLSSSSFMGGLCPLYDR
jgi:hypothetical protein